MALLRGRRCTILSFGLCPSHTTSTTWRKKTILSSGLGIIGLLSTAFAVVRMVLTFISTVMLVPVEVSRSFAFFAVVLFLKYARHSNTLWFIIIKFINGWMVLMAFGMTLMACLVLFSSLLFLVEHERNDHSKSVLVSFWYTIVSLTTVGYGDMITVTSIRKIISTVTVLFGKLCGNKFYVSILLDTTGYERTKGTTLRVYKVGAISQRDNHKCQWKQPGKSHQTNGTWYDAEGLSHFFSNLLFLAEHERNDQLESVLASFWYTIVSLTTVGYEDMMTVTPMGKIISTVTVLFGIIAVINLMCPFFWTPPDKKWQKDYTSSLQTRHSFVR